MSIPLLGTGGLFTRLGKLAKILRLANIYSDTTLDPAVTVALGALGSEYGLAAPLAEQQASIKSAPNSVGGIVQQMMQSVLIRMVNEDVTLSNTNDLALAMNELINQIIAAAAYVSPCTVTATVTATTVFGNGAFVTTTKRGDGLVQENLFAETATLTCTGDAQNQTAAAGSEPWQFLGDQAPSGTFGPDWPGASGVTVNLTTVDSMQSANSTGNLLTNSDFESYVTTPNIPDNWVRVIGVAGTTIKQNTSIFFRGLSSLEFDGTGSELTEITQLINDPTGTPVRLTPRQSYAVNLWYHQATLPAAGILSLSLVDGSNAMILDDQGTPNEITLNLHTAIAGSGFTPFGGVFRTPRSLPDTIKFRLRLSTALESGKTVNFDSLAMTPVTRLYAGGPGLSIFAGSIPFLTGDVRTVATTNDRASATYGSTWQAEFQRFYNMSQLGVLLPSSGMTLIADTLITA
jgi:hypothetical protein